LPTLDFLFLSRRRWGAALPIKEVAAAAVGVGVAVLVLKVEVLEN
jgi:hypothetical protein